MKNQSSSKMKQVVRKVVKQPPTTGSVMQTANSHTAPITADNGDTIEERIRRRAYQLYEQRGCQAGLDLADWLQAERELVAAP